MLIVVCTRASFQKRKGADKKYNTKLQVACLLEGLETMAINMVMASESRTELFDGLLCRIRSRDGKIDGRLID